MADKLLANQARATSSCAQLEFLIEASTVAIDLFDPAKSLRYAQFAQKLPCKDSQLRMKAKIREASAYNLMEKLDSAILLTREVLAYTQHHQDSSLEVSAHSNLGMMLNKQGEFKEALNAFQRAHQLIKMEHNERQRSISFLNISLCHLNLNHLNEGLSTIDSAIYYAKKADLTPILAHSYGLKSALFHKKKDTSSWLSTLDSAIACSMNAQNFIQAAYGLNDKLEHYVSTKDYKKAVIFGNQALSIIQDKDQYALLIKNYKGLYTAYHALGELPKAIYYLDRYTTLKDSLDQSTFKNQVHELNLKYEVAAKDNQILKQQSTLSRFRFYLILAFSALVVFASSLYFIYWKNRLQKQTIAALFQKERHLEQELATLQKLVPAQPITTTTVVEPNETPISLALQLKAFLETEKPYLNPEFNRNDLLAALGTNRTYFSQAVNQLDAGGLRALINQYRINYAKEIIWKIASKTISEPISKVWELSGFNSNPVFYRTFKAQTNLTPKEYLEQVEIELHKRNGQLPPA